MSNRVTELIKQMTLPEKIGQMSQLTDDGGNFADRILEGGVGSFLNAGTVKRRNELQRVAVDKSRLGIPLIFGRDVIHGYNLVFPIPLGQAASWNLDIIEEAARIAALHASSRGIDWTFAPMVDISRDPRWGRIAEGAGEDPYLSGAVGAAMVRGFQGPNMSERGRIAACAKHYVGYGASEAGRDYNTTYIPERLLREVYLPSFKACADAGCATIMSAFNDLNGVPASGNAFTLKDVLKNEWDYSGFVVSDWDSIVEMIPHGFAADKRSAAMEGVTAGVDMEMVSDAYWENIQSLIESSKIDISEVDDAVRRILTVKEQIGLFDHPYPDESSYTSVTTSQYNTAKAAASDSIVLLENKNGTLPLKEDGQSIAVIGCLADAAADQLGCWVMDGDPDLSVTPLSALQDCNLNITYAPGLSGPRSTDTTLFDDAVSAASKADTTILFLGEDAGLSGEAHSRAFIDLPGAQLELAKSIKNTGTRIVAVIMAGRPLVLSALSELADAVVYAWHPGSMGGPAIVDVLFGKICPSGKLPVSFPRALGQIPIYYANRSTGRPPSASKPSAPTGTPLDPTDFCSAYLDVDHRPLYPFGYGLSYTQFSYSDVTLSSNKLQSGDSLTASAEITNSGTVAGREVVQLYTRDMVASVTRPVRELKGFKSITLDPGESETVTFTITDQDLRFWDRSMEYRAEPGRFQLWICAGAESGTFAEFDLV